MKILWVVYPLFPDLAVALGQNKPVGGGWMYGLAKDLEKKEISLSVATVRPDYEDCHEVVNNIDYYLLKAKKNREVYDSSLEPKWKKLIATIKPDVVHIHGTEYAHGLALMKACPKVKYVISIQGMPSVYERYFLGGISRKEIWNKYTFRDFLKQDSLWQAQAKFKKRGQKVEVPFIEIATDIIGRTQWDNDHVKSINPNVNYHFCNESLRDEFYDSPKWNHETKKTHSIFLSQAGYPLKGLHKVLEAVNIIKTSFPDIHIRIARNPITKSNTLIDKIKMGGYGKYISSIIKKYDLQNNITFTGALNAAQMVQEYHNAHVFICPSSIENSPNSLGEAQLLGTPCISSFVGGVADMVEHNKTGLLYRFEEVEMLAQAIKRVFTDSELAKQLSKNSILEASKRHHREVNVNRLIEIYKNLK